MKTLIIENELNAQELLTALIQQYRPELEILGYPKTNSEAKDQFRKIKPQLIFLDIELDDGKSFDFLEAVDLEECKIIFTTAYDQYALKAFEFNALDYLLKPYSPKEFKRSVDRAFDVLRKSEEFKGINEIIKSFSEGLAKEKISISTEHGVRLLEKKDIIRIEADGSYSKVVMFNGEKILISKSLARFEELLQLDGFKRVHQSHLINLNAVSAFKTEDGGILCMENEDQVPVSRRKKSELISVLKF